MSKLSLYAPGDGSLHFTLIDDKGCAIGSPTMEEAAKFLQLGRNIYHMASHRLVCRHGDPLLVPVVERLDDTHLRLNGEVYEYSAEWLDGSLYDSYLTVRFTDSTGKVREAKNWSLRASILFFLRNEKELAELPTRPVGTEPLYPDHLWSVTATVTSSSDGYSCTTQVPAFILNGAALEVDTADAVAKVAEKIINPTNNPDLTVSVCAVAWKGV